MSLDAHASPFHLMPQSVSPVRTPFRLIQTDIPAPQTLETLRTLVEREPRSMLGQPPIVWDRAEGFQVFDVAGNKWLDWSSGVVVASAGHGRPEIIEAITEEARRPLLHNY